MQEEISFFRHFHGFETDSKIFSSSEEQPRSRLSFDGHKWRTLQEVPHLGHFHWFHWNTERHKQTVSKPKPVVAFSLQQKLALILGHWRAHFLSKKLCTPNSALTIVTECKLHHDPKSCAFERPTSDSMKAFTKCMAPEMSFKNPFLLPKQYLDDVGIESNALGTSSHIIGSHWQKTDSVMWQNFELHSIMKLIPSKKSEKYLTINHWRFVAGALSKLYSWLLHFKFPKDFSIHQKWKFQISFNKQMNSYISAIPH